MIYVYAKYQKPTPYIKRDIANVKVFTTPAGRPDGRTAGRNRHYIDSHCIACESKNKWKNGRWGMGVGSEEWALEEWVLGNGYWRNGHWGMGVGSMGIRGIDMGNHG